jgi:AP-4 complex subunit mu-1
MQKVTDFCGGTEEEMLRTNFVLVYEIMDEIIDYGYP